VESLSGVVLDEGHPWPLGAHCDDDAGINFAVFSAHAQAIELCLFDASGTRELRRLAVPGRTGDVWHGRLRGVDVGAGLVYGLRAHGPWEPEHGHRFNPHKLLLDPYAREIVGRFDWRSEQFGADPVQPRLMDRRDNALHALKARVIDERPATGDVPEPRPHTPLAETVLYEAHVKGLTMRHPGVPEPQRGSYAGLASDAAIAHLQRLGVTAISLLPLHQHLDEQRLVEQGLSNYWGYNTIGFFAVEPRYASGAGGLSPRQEFRAMVRRLHAAGIEVILDVVFNHTAETDSTGPTISWRGLDNLSYYRTPPGEPGTYDNLSGCGNTLDLRHPRVLQMVMDSLRHWAGTMNVDGFRFDLAPVLGRSDDGFDPHAAFFQVVAQDPLLGRLKLIAEPWDLGPGGYQLGRFPRGWLEWNDRFRDGMRSFWLGGASTRGEFAQRLCASSDLFHVRGRTPAESVNFIAAHDGFTLRDLLTWERKRNTANGEDNRDGHGANHGWNCGAEGPSDDAQVRALRARLQRSLLAMLLLAQGTPMLAAGDELGHSQDGNNNPYCQDNPTTWIAWAEADEALIAFTARVIALRRRLLPLADHWYSGSPERDGLRDLAWLRADGQSLTGDDWRDPSVRTLGGLIGAPGKASLPLLLLVNAEAKDSAFTLPAGAWQALLDTARAGGEGAWHGTASYPLAGHSVTLLSRVPPLP
jgi:glycogen debranching enzyme GlgX